MDRRKDPTICRIALTSACQGIFILAPLVSLPSQAASSERSPSELLVAAKANKQKNANRARRASTRREEFDHLQTGFPLTGAHARVKCESCHVQGVLKGTPKQCSGCHSSGRGIAITVKPANHIPTNAECDQCHRSNVWTVLRFDHSTLGLSGTPQLCNNCHNGFMAEGKPANHIVTNASCDVCHSTRGWLPATFSHSLVAPGSCASCHNGVAATGKPANHIVTAASCDNCHSTQTWTSATFDHAGVAPATCASCHNGVTATGKPTNHIPTTGSCDACHSTRVWRPATFDHSTVTPGSCAGCHNGITATGKPGNHIVTTASCDNCHRTTAWIPATFDHSGVAPGTCASCHNGTTATGKPANHIPTTASCDSCHNARAWLPATFDHSGVAPGTCASCHNGAAATGKPGGHFVTSRSCDACHSSTRWTPMLNYAHTSPFFPSGHTADVTCNDCHTANSDVISWNFGAYKPDCAGCHADDYKPDEHKKTKNPTKILYTVSELRDCAGSCHEYTDNTFTTILETKTGKHQPSKGDW